MAPLELTADKLLGVLTRHDVDFVVIGGPTSPPGTPTSLRTVRPTTSVGCPMP
ncbi:MAG TPA: hypothetical protein VHW64_15435 [Nocardioides sp.]|uniref:hypothetical protein n=1 Tax=Nocardioides sp. TaxID=35761 RepID=UPI002E35CDD6|nr:hypothetical protein [Nocardioides sp.]HEX3932096.1 hypothetical protein [Nocardioides sp.]